ncbi:MAG: hypothetical protein L3J92_03465 [Thermoplasmata archaeon]|nr:hypothetical protein [Thermoplasmata archaeon]
MQGRGTGPASLQTSVVVGSVLLLVFAGLVAVSAIAPRPSSTAAGLVLETGGVTIDQFSFQPPDVNSGSETSGSVTLSGGTAPYFLWFNDTPPGCSPSSTPVTISTTPYTFQCTPTSAGTYTVHLAVVDSSVPSSSASGMTGLTVMSNGNGNHNGSGNGSGSNNGGGGNTSLGSLIPSGFLEIGLIVALVVIGSVVAIAAGVIAMAVLVPRRLRQLNETLAKSGLPPKEPKPPG